MTKVSFDPSAPLAEARSKLLDAVSDFADLFCPCCGQRTKLYHRKLNTGMAYSLIMMWKAGGEDFIHLPTSIPTRSREEGKLRHWGLVEEAKEKRPDGGRAGWWRLTPDGISFVQGKITVPSHVWLYLNHFIALDPSHQLSIQQALGERFNYMELMYGKKESGEVASSS